MHRESGGTGHRLAVDVTHISVAVLLPQMQKRLITRERCRGDVGTIE
jgi:hypothetical protein